MVDLPKPGTEDAVLRSNGNAEDRFAEPIVLKMPIGIRSVALSILTVLGLVFLLRFAKDLFVPAVLAILIAYALNPLVTLLTRIRIPRVVASIIVFFGLSL
jgi:predicted PurR-regulated permease PerM